MASPLKPWEIRPDVARRSQIPNTTGRPTVRFRIPPGTTKSDVTMDQRDFDSPPPIPSRQRNTEKRGSNVPYGSSYYGTSTYGMPGGYGYGGYGLSGYNNYSSYGYNRPMNLGPNNIQPSVFARRAEESCQPAFNSVQSIVQAFASIATMLDSTFFAVHSSFRAVLGVADQLSGLKTHITNTLGAFAIFKAIRFVYRKIMSWLRLRNYDMDIYDDDIWNEATKEVLKKQDKKSSKSWPVVLFFAVVLGTPWLIWKLLQTISGDEETEEWISGHSEHFEAQAEYSFDAENEDEISFQAGDVLQVAPKHKQPHVRGWLLASVDGKISGLVPANYIKILGRRRGKRGRRHDERDLQTETDNVAENHEDLTEIYNESSSDEGQLNRTQR